jgi:glyoxylase-like metal-dependent hydrolase (beta-lactamase superfamily II)
MHLVFEQVRTGGDRNFAYLLGDRDARQAVLVDPSYAPEVLVERARAQGLQVSFIVNTHGHADHIEGNERAVALTGARVAAHPDLAAAPADVAVADGQILDVGAFRLHCLHTPGHSADHIVVYEPFHRLLLTGDLIFVGKVGGTPTDEAARTEWKSLRRVLREVADETTLWPGHDYGVRPSSTIALERATNPFLQCPDDAAFLELKRDWPSFKARHGLK